MNNNFAPQIAISKFTRVFCFLVLSLLALKPAIASHNTGGEIYYSCTGTPGVYNITVKLYRDCGGVQLCSNCPTSLSPSCALTLNITGAGANSNGVPAQLCGGVSYGTVTCPVAYYEGGKEISQFGKGTNSICSNCGTRTPGTYSPGTEVYTFIGQVNLNSLPASCCFVSLSFSSCCRSAGISNIVSPSYNNNIVEATINRCASPCNSSPVFSENAQILGLSGKDVSMNFGMADPDGDSVVYLKSPTFINPGVPATYASPFTSNTPLNYQGFPAISPPASGPDGIYLDPYTGLMRFRPIGNFVVALAVQAYQYKKVLGVPTLMGITRRDFQFYSMLASSSSIPQFARYKDTNTIVYTSNYESNYDTICVGTTICRTIVAHDSDAVDTTYIRRIYQTPGFSTTYTRLFDSTTRAINGPRQDSVKFCFTASAANVSAQPFYLHLEASTPSRPGILEKTNTSFVVVVRPTPILSMQKISIVQPFTYKFKFTNSGSATLYSSQTEWQIESMPGSNTYTSYVSDSVTSHTFPISGKYRIRLNVVSSCGITSIMDSLSLSNLAIQLVSSKNNTCKNDSSGGIIVSASGGNKPYMFKLNSQAFGVKDTFTKLVAGLYTITVRDSLGFMQSMPVTLTQPANAPVLFVSQFSQPTCNGDSNGVVTLSTTNTQAPLLFKKDLLAYQSSPIYSGLKAGASNYQVIDSLGCKATLSYTLTQTSAITFSFTSKASPRCPEQVFGQVILFTQGGKLPYQYRMDGGKWKSSSTFDSIPIGFHSFETKDSNNCLRPALTYTVTAPNAFGGNYSVLQKPSCTINKATVSISGWGGLPPYTYWYDGGPGGSAQTYYPNLNPGTYTFHVLDANICYFSITDTIKPYVPMVIAESIKKPTCDGYFDGAVTILASKGNSPYLFKLDSLGTYGTFNGFTNLSAGTYVACVKDNSNCVQTKTITVSNPLPISSKVETKDETCAGANNGEAEVIISGGTIPYATKWLTTPIKTTSKITGLAAGIYSVQILDSNLCSKNDVATINSKSVFQNESICLVSVDTITGKNRISWNKTMDKGTASFDILAAPSSVATPVLVKNVLYTDSSSWMDNVSSNLPIGQAYYYYLKSVDSCGLKSGASMGHKALVLTASKTGNAINLSWLPYEGNQSITGYELFKSVGSGYQSLGTFPLSINSFTDNFQNTSSQVYVLEALSTQICFSNSHIYSNRVQFLPTGLKYSTTSNTEFKLFPNPSTGKITVSAISGKREIIGIEIHSMLGIKLFEQTYPNPQSEIAIDLGSIESGAYQAFIQTNTGARKVLTFVIRR
ncbi:MAG: hypothetical protein CFE21_08130 [Bacteroidetes bacterium B1(2017)]|nr:MAG: hypothetical protein CFE21_08130 [Bacteroidetes bacterium B1(2017)]